MINLVSPDAIRVDVKTTPSGLYLCHLNRPHRASKQALGSLAQKSSPYPLARFTPIPVLGIVACLALAGCSSFPVTDDKEQKNEFNGRVDAHGSLPVLPRTFNNLAFVRLLAGEGESECNGKDIDNKLRTPAENKDIEFQCAIDQFYKRTTTQNEGLQRLERNRIQERILAVSEERCNAYKKYLRYDQGASNFWLGSAATLFGTLGALSSGVGAARSFSAGAGVLTGINAEYNQAFYGNLFYSVITKGIDERRREAYHEIQLHGQAKNLADYAVEAAIKDAIVYDGMCSAVSAMEYAEKSIQLANDPGLNSLNRILVKVNQAHNIIENKTLTLSPQQESSDGKLVSTGEDIRFGTLLANNERVAPQHFIQARLRHAQQKVTALDPVKREIERTLNSQNKGKLKLFEQAISDKFGEISNTGFSGYQQNLQICTNTLLGFVKELEDARAALTKALAAKDSSAENQATHQISQAQIKIDGTLESADFITRHLDDLVDGFVKQTVQDIQADSKDTTGKPVLTYDISRYGSFDGTVCGKLNPAAAKP